MDHLSVFFDRRCKGMIFRLRLKSEKHHSDEKNNRENNSQPAHGNSYVVDLVSVNS